jgi:CRISPR-associated protein Csd1
MTILSSLDAHYARLERASAVAPFGFSTESISFALVLSTDGDLLSCHDLRDRAAQRPIGRPLTVPWSFKRPGTTPRAFFLWDNSKFVLGLGSATADGGLVRYAGHAAAFRATHERLLNGTTDRGLLAVLRFLHSWTPDRFGHAPVESSALDRNLVFHLNGDLSADGQPRFVHERPAARAVWERQLTDRDRPSRVCLATGRIAPVARLHPAIKGVRGAYPAGASLVSFNRNAFTSHGKEQGDNAPVSEAAAFAYGAALNTLLARNSPNRVLIGDTTTVFWADASVCGEASARRAETLVARALVPERTSEISATDLAREQGEGSRFRALIQDHRSVERIGLDLDPAIRFHILGLAPNGPRLSVRFWHETTLGLLLARLAEHWEDLRIEPPAWRGPPSPLALLRVLARRDDTNTVPPVLGGELMRAVLTGGRYPRALLVAVIQRLRAGEPINGPRAALCKAVLQRDTRLRHQHRGRPLGAFTGNEREVPVSLDRQEMDPAYRLGRLFAVLENAQRAALGRLNGSIHDRYFGAASATPASVFPLLLRNAAHHLAVLRKDPRTGGLAFWFEGEINGIMEGLGVRWPRHLRLESQTRFIVGYYHQRYARKSVSDGDAGSPVPEPSCR